MTVKEIFVRIGVKTDDASFRKAQRSVEGLENSSKKLSGGLKDTLGKAAKFGAVFAAGVTTAVVAGRKLAQLAGDVEETNNLIDVAFGKGADSFRKFAADLATATGKSKFELQELGASMQATVSGLTQDAELAQNLTQKLTERGVDLASVFNLNVTDALNKLRSGITGEAEPLKSLGIVMNQTTLKAFALSQGITKSTKSMTQAELATLRTNFILAQTAKFHGDATNTAGSLANQMKALDAAFGDIAKELAVALAPHLKEIIQLMVQGAKAALNIIRNFEMWSSQNSALVATIQTIGVVIARVVDFIGTTLAALQFLFLDIFQRGLGPALAEFTDNMLNAFSELLGQDLPALFREFGTWVIDTVSEIADDIVDTIKEGVKSSLGFVGGLAGRALDFGSGLFGGGAQPTSNNNTNVANNQSQVNNITVNAAPGQSEQSIGANVSRGINRGFQATLNQSGRAFAAGG